MSTGRQGRRQVIPFVGLGRQHAALGGELREAFERVLGADAFILGGEVEGSSGSSPLTVMCPSASGWPPARPRSPWP